MTTDCAGSVFNWVGTLIIAGLCAIQLVMMLHKRICCTWKFFLTLFIFAQTTILFFLLLLNNEFYWTFILTFLEMSAFLFILWFFTQYFGRVNSHSDEVNPFVFFSLLQLDIIICLHSSRILLLLSSALQMDETSFWSDYILYAGATTG